MRTDLRSLLRLLVDAVSFSPTGISWFGDDFDLGDPATDSTDEGFIDLLGAILYSHFFTIGRPMLKAEADLLVHESPRRSLMAQLDLANRGKGRLDAGWTYLGCDSDSNELIVRKNGLSLSVSRDHVDWSAVFDTSDTELREGTTVSVKMPAGSMWQSPGHYVAHSDASFDLDGPLSRFYLNVGPDHADQLLAMLTTDLNRIGLSFDFKVASDTVTFYRADVAVLYVPRAQYGVAFERIDAVLPRLAEALRPATPPFTLAVRPGVAVADDPGEGDSFGTDRCKRVAAAIYSSRWITAFDERVESVVVHLERSGVDPRRPYLLPANAEDLYAAGRDAESV